MVRIELTEHAERRMAERGLTRDAIEAAMTFGREIHTRGVTIFAVGRKCKRLSQASEIFRSLRELTSCVGRTGTSLRHIEITICGACVHAIAVARTVISVAAP